MTDNAQNIQFESLNHGYNTTFSHNRLSIGLVVPIEAYPSSAIASMDQDIKRVQLAEKLRFSSVWLRDVPFNVPSFGDAGQLYDPFVYLGFLAAQTQSIALGVASIILPLRHPAHVAKSAASVDTLSNGRLIMGIASGDRPQEYPAMNLSFDDRGRRFRESFDYIRKMQNAYPAFSNSHGQFSGNIDMLPKPQGKKLPLLVTGHSQQNPDWIAQNSDGWMIYPRTHELQRQIIDDFQSRVAGMGRSPQPVMQPLYFDLADPQQNSPRPLHLGFSSNTSYLLEYLKQLESAGVNHVALNLRFNQKDVAETLHQLAEEVLPHF